MSSQTTSKPTVLSARSSGMRVFIAVFLLIHIPLFIYPVLRLSGWFELSQWVTLLVLVPVASSQIISRWLLRNPKNSAIRKFRQIMDLLLGVSPIVLMSLLAAEILVLSKLLLPFHAAVVVLCGSTAVALLGLGLATMPAIKTVSFESAALMAPVRFVQITDVHIGSRSRQFLERVVSRIRSLSPDFVCITGDFIDATGVPKRDLAALGTLECPIYFTLGNHERYEDLDAIIERLESLGVIVLRSQTLSYREDIQIIGIDDRDDALQVERELSKITLAENCFKILLYHRPRGLSAAANAGIHLMLSGHTHNGQIFPFNLLVRRVFERIAGLYELNGSRLYVSQGTGTWGPVMRVGTRSEITLFELEENTNG